MVLGVVGVVGPLGLDQAEVSTFNSGSTLGTLDAANALLGSRRLGLGLLLEVVGTGLFTVGLLDSAISVDGHAASIRTAALLVSEARVGLGARGGFGVRGGLGVRLGVEVRVGVEVAIGEDNGVGLGFKVGVGVVVLVGYACVEIELVVGVDLRNGVEVVLLV